MALTLTMDLKLCAMSIATYLGDLLTPRDIAAESSTEHSVTSHRWLYQAEIFHRVSSVQEHISSRSRSRATIRISFSALRRTLQPLTDDLIRIEATLVSGR